VVTDRVGVIEELGAERSIYEDDLLCVGLAVVAEEAPGERRDAQRGEVARNDQAALETLLGTELVTIQNATGQNGSGSTCGDSPWSSEMT
jgi:hypothetical protein